jgi:hypothetical protein
MSVRLVRRSLRGDTCHAVQDRGMRGTRAGASATLAARGGPAFAVLVVLVVATPRELPGGVLGIFLKAAICSRLVGSAPGSASSDSGVPLATGVPGVALVTLGGMRASVRRH